MPRPSRSKPERSTVQYLIDRFVGNDPKRIASFERAMVNARVAQAIYDLRTAAKLSQSELARQVGTTASVIGQLEDANYDGHTLAMLSRIARSLGRRVELSFPLIDPAAE